MQTNPTITHTSPTGRIYRVVMVEQMLDPPSKWIASRKAFCSHWCVLIQYSEGDKANLFYDYDDKLIKVVPL